MKINFRKFVVASAVLGFLTVGCGDDDANNVNNSNNINNSNNSNNSNNTNNSNNPNNTNNANNVNNQNPEGYSFQSRFDSEVSSVAYSGQTFRHVLISDLKSYIGGLGGDIDQGTFVPTDDGDVVSALDFYYRFDSSVAGDEPILLSTDPATVQMTYNDISSDKDLVGKTAGNDTVTDHVDFSTEFTGWSDGTIAAFGGSTDSPEGLITAFFETLEEEAIARANNMGSTAPDGSPLPVYVTASGLDLSQLIQKFLLVSVAFHQAADDYGDDDVDGKGLLADNEDPGDNPYTGLEHQWDEAFGYFGAARDYYEYTDEEIAGKGGRDAWSSGYYDTDGDGAIDLLSEYNFGASVNAGKRDLGAVTPTDFTAMAFNGFVDGRALITNAGGALTDDQLDELKTYRDAAIGGWEMAYAATVVHYINDTLQDMNDFGTAEYSFTDHAKHWAEMKGFALGFQFNPRSPLSDTQFVEFHTLVGDRPILEADGDTAIDAYKTALIDARDLLQSAYGFDEANMGDANGEGGW